MDDCIFCKIVRGEIPSAKVYEDDEVICFPQLGSQQLLHPIKILLEIVFSLQSFRSPLPANFFYFFSLLCVMHYRS
ncbi:hypothetical protein PNT60_14465, partial [Listeria monocytogenes]|nr:hypothetical protein [Listeria monocytogenes]